MADLETENEQVEQLGGAWIQSIMEGKLERLEQFCHPEVVSRLLTPTRFVTLDNVVDLLAKYRRWFGECTHFRLEASRIEQVGERLGIFYRFQLQEHGDWYIAEQQLFCTLKDGRLEKLDLVCSGFQPIRTSEQNVVTDTPEVGEQDPARDELLEFHTEASDIGSTCAILTPAIKSKLRGMNSGQVLEVRVDDPSARGDIEAWCRLSGNTLLKVIDHEGQMLRFFVQKKQFL